MCPSKPVSWPRESNKTRDEKEKETNIKTKNVGYCFGSYKIILKNDAQYYLSMKL